ncbi:hypothetical protein SLH46_16645 [Draconibacterium sp. IB214405]|uniref:hypothetical protein n=1 Tax=Draconibacterium sp. IB214405 TaxID=3097352 RepID=UPI002A10370D|nr:hypothetical protein [Draconibacterium sp. IB214405]MDX8340828.1 hypothetical protein [Draconibacterium sp. IB214405]
MKNTVLIFIALLPLFCFSQNENCGFFIETGVTMFGGGDYMPFVGKTGISFWQSKTFVDRNGDVELYEGYNYHVTSFSIAPRFGYCLSKKLAVGLDFQYFRNYNAYRGAYDDKENYRNFLAGIFLRYTILDKKHSPFVELASGTGISKNMYKSYSSGGGRYDLIKYDNLPYIAGSLGYLFRLNDSFKVGIAATVQNTLEKPNDKGNVGTDIDRVSILETGMVASISYYFKKRQKPIE